MLQKQKLFFNFYSLFQSLIFTIYNQANIKISKIKVKKHLKTIYINISSLITTSLGYAIPLNEKKYYNQDSIFMSEIETKMLWNNIKRIKLKKF